MTMDTGKVDGKTNSIDGSGLIVVALVLGIVALGAALACGTTGVNYVPPLPPVPDLSGPPLMEVHTDAAVDE